MKIKLTEDRRVVGTKHAWELQKRQLVSGEYRWRAFKWLPSFSSAVQESIHAEIREHPTHDLSEAIQAVDAILRRYARLIPDEYEIRLRERSS